MTKKKSNRSHGHYCKICKEYKANEKFSGQSHAVHICKACSRFFIGTITISSQVNGSDLYRELFHYSNSYRQNNKT